MTDGKPLSSLVSKKYSVSCPPLPPLAPECDDNPWSAAMKFHSSSQPVITTFSCSKDQAPTYILVWQNLRSVVQKWHFCLWHDLPWCVIRPCEISVVRSVKGKKKDVPGWKAFSCCHAASLPLYPACRSHCATWWPSWQTWRTWAARRRHDAGGHHPPEAAAPRWHPPGKHCRKKRILDG